MDKSERKDPEGFASWSSLVSYGYIVLWIALSATVILYNKWVLSIYGFSYPVTLTLLHMVFCSVLAWILVLLGWVESISMNFDTFIRAFMPIGALYAGTLWLGNAAYLYLSVSFIQMLKAMMPVCVFVVGSVAGTERYTLASFVNMLVISAGVAAASYVGGHVMILQRPGGLHRCLTKIHRAFAPVALKNESPSVGNFHPGYRGGRAFPSGEINFVLVGVLLQLSSLVTESIRLTLVQIILQRRNLKLNPITTLSYVAPCCCAFLLIPFTLLELPRLTKDTDLRFDPAIMLSNAVAAFALNLSVFLLIGKTSALTMNLAGVVKDWLLIGLSAVLYKSPVTELNIGGYSVAFLAVCWYNYSKLKGLQKAPERPPPNKAKPHRF